MVHHQAELLRGGADPGGPLQHPALLQPLQQRRQGHTVLGHTVLGHTVLGHTVLGNTVLGHTVLGHTVLGHTVLGHTVLGHTVLWHTVLNPKLIGGRGEGILCHSFGGEHRQSFLLSLYF